MSTDIPIYVISLRRVPERRLSVQRQLDALNLKYQIIEAFDGRDFFSKDYRLKVAREFGMNEDAIEKNVSIWSSTWSPYAILFSHIKAYNSMIKNNIPLACILEDDTDISPVFPEILNNVQQFPWDILMLANHSDSVGRLINTLVSIMRHKSYRSVCRKLIKHYMHKPRLSLRQHLIAMQCAFNIVKRHWHLYPYSIVRKSSFDINRVVINFENVQEKQAFWQYYVSKMGAAFSHDKAFKHHITDNYYIASKLPEYCQGGMGYMLRLETAEKWKKEALTDKHGHIDFIPKALAERNEVRLSIVTPPCITALYSYLAYSTRRHDLPLRHHRV